MLLNGHISEMNKHVVQLTGARRVFDCAEPAEAELVPEDRRVTKHTKHHKTAIFHWVMLGSASNQLKAQDSHVTLQRSVCGHQNIETQVKLLPSN